MAHIVIWVGEPAVSYVLRAVFEEYEADQGHQVTTCNGEDFWQLLAVLKSSLHPVVAILDDDVHYLGAQEYQAFAANLDALRQHRYVELRWAESVPASSPAQVLYQHCEVQVVRGPYDIDEDVIPAVNRAASGLPEHTTRPQEPGTEPGRTREGGAPS